MSVNQHQQTRIDPQPFPPNAEHFSQHALGRQLGTLLQILSIKEEQLRR